MIETARISIVDSDGNGVTFAPFKFTLDERGDQGEAYHSEGWIDISDLRLGFPIRDGEIQIEFHLTDNPIAGPEVTYLDGSTLSVEVVPAPGTAALLGMGGLAVARRRRR